MNLNKRQLQQWVARRSAVMSSRPKKLKAKKPVRWLYPSSAEREYQRNLQAIIESQRKVAREMMPDVLRQVREEQSQMHADSALMVKTLNDRLMAEFQKYNINLIAGKAMGDTASYNKAQFNRVVKSAIQVDVFKAEPWLGAALESATASNVALITKMNADTLGSIGEMVGRAGRGGIRAEDLTAEIMERFDVGESKAKLIARDQVGKFNGELTRTRQGGLGIEEYIWRTAEDDRVRPEHEAHNGQTFRWDDPPADTGHPGEDVQCRCYAEPKFDSLLEGL